MAIADNFTSAGERGLIKGIIVAQQIAAGDLPGAKATLLRFSPKEMNGRDHYVASIAYALHTAGNLEEALSLVCQIGTEDMRANAMWEVLYAQKQRGDGSNAERAAAKIENEEVKKQAFGIIANINRGTYEQNLQIEVLRGYAPS